MRVVTLLPSATEIVCALGLDPVGVSHECDHPDRVRDLPAVNRSHVDPGAESATIDEQVVSAKREHGGVYEIDLETLSVLDPDLIVTQGICDVCAVDSVLVERAVERLGLDCRVLTTDPHSVGDVLADVERIGDALDRPDRAGGLVAGLRSRIERVRGRTRDVEERPRAVVLDWLSPPMVAGHWIPEMVEWAGGEYGMAEPGARSTVREWTAVPEYDPEVLIAAPCGFGLERTVRETSELTDRPDFGDLAAAGAGAVYAVDGNHYVNRPGPRLVDTLELFAAILHPDRFEVCDGSAAERIGATPLV
ncbi:ABC transporter substrate-binding protein [Natronorarus salvus]|uniref:ABC transporter substrate-binding protein n=1 Tax=Natronorarus salvus TaxID=3117733 RepID=UPI002F26DC09